MAGKVTVIGGSGFVGTSLCRRLAVQRQDFEILDLKMSDHFPERCKIADVRNVEELRQTITGDVVVLLAAVHRDDVQDQLEYIRTNVDGAENVALVCQEKGIDKIVFTSSVAVYGFAEPGTDENGEIKPFNHYGRSKFDAEEKLRLWNSKGANSLTIVRPTVIFGEGNRGNVYNLFKQIASGKFVMIGRGENKKSMAYVGNVAAFLEVCIKRKEKHELYNYVDNPDMTMNELVDLVRYKLQGKKGVGIRIPFFLGLFLGYVSDFISVAFRVSLPLSSIRVKKFTTSSSFSTNARDLISFQAPFKLHDSILKTLETEFITASQAGTNTQVK